MRYTCENCGAQLFENERELDKALGSGKHSVKCKYCGEFNEFATGGTRHIDLGYDYLSSADFHKAEIEFNDAIRQGESIYAYLGLALAKYSVQTVFPDDRECSDEMPRLICHTYKEHSLSDDADFHNACRCISKLQSGIQKREMRRLQEYTKITDGVFGHYKQLFERHGGDFEYSAFVAYEDEKKEGKSNDGFFVANNVRNILADNVSNVYVPDIEACGNDRIKYEAEILFALDRSRCMLVIADESIDARLQRLYARYYKKRNGSEKTLAFIKYMNKFSAHLPNGREPSNVFDISDKDGFCDYVCGINNKIYKPKQIKPPKPPVGPSVVPNDDSRDRGKKLDDTDFKFAESGLLKFGSYPQERSTNARAKEVFDNLPMPDKHNDNGWSKLYRFGWYRDETVDGKKYRAVYFLKARAPYSENEKSGEASAQVNNGFTRAKVYIFSFAPVYWKNITVGNSANKVFAADMALFSREFYSGNANEKNLSGWLEKDFAQTAFSEDERKKLMASEHGTRVFLLSSGEELDTYLDKRSVIMGSDYMQCAGGLCNNRTVQSFWIDDGDLAPHVAYANGNVATNAADSTTVAVIPKIILRI